jgi:hypothetical protein
MLMMRAIESPCTSPAGTNIPPTGIPLVTMREAAFTNIHEARGSNVNKATATQHPLAKINMLITMREAAFTNIHEARGSNVNTATATQHT